MRKLSGWKIEFVDGSEGYCWRKEKRITIGVKNSNILRLILHEMAHIKSVGHGNQHTQSWFNEYLRLHHKFLRKTDISKSDKLIAKTYNLKEKDNG